MNLELPEIADEAALEELLTRPRPALVEFIRTLSGRLLILGAGGKMGPTLALLAKRAAEAAGRSLEVVAASRFSDASSRRWLEARGVSTVQADLLERADVARLPDAPHVIYLAGMKFGTRENPSLTWALNTLAPSQVAERYMASRMVALSTANVYPMTSTSGGGATEENPLTPVGEYANAAVARERIFEHCSRKHGSKLALLRLSYAVDLRYGVLLDIARRVQSGEPVNVTSARFNCIWQGDANEMILRSLDLTANPPAVFNLSHPVSLSIRETALKFAQLFGVEAKLAGTEAGTSLFINSERLASLLGPPATDLDDLIHMSARWVQNGGRSLNKPTGFEVRDGAY